MSLARESPRTRSWIAAIDALLVVPRVRFVCIAMLAVMGGLALLSTIRGAPAHDVFGQVSMPDLLAHITGGALVRGGNAPLLYDLAAQQRTSNAIVPDRDLHLFLSPPFVAWMYAPFAAVPYRVAVALWFAIIVAQIAGAAWLLRGLAREWQPGHARIAIVVALASAPMLDLFGSGQDTGLTLLLWCAGASLTIARRDVLAGIVWGLGWFKPQLFVIVPFMLLAQRRWRVLASYASMSLVMGALALSVDGTHGLRAWRALVTSSQYRDWITGTLGWKMQSLPALARALAPPSLAQGAGLVATLLGVLAAAVLVVLAWRAHRAPEHDRNEVRAWTWWSAACLATLIASPHLFLYDLVLASFPFTVAFGHDDARARVWLAIAMIIAWSGGVRALAFAAHPWPLRALAGGFTVLPLAALYVDTLRRLSATAPSRPSSFPSRSA